MTYKNYISGRWVSSDSGKLFLSDNPADDSCVGSFQVSTRTDVQHAIASAEIAFRSWRDVPAPQRAKYLFNFLKISNYIKFKNTI